jgi:hypothetical protein
VLATCALRALDRKQFSAPFQKARFHTVWAHLGRASAGLFTKARRVRTPLLRGRLIRLTPGRKAFCVSALVDGARGARAARNRGAAWSRSPARGTIPNTRRLGLAPAPSPAPRSRSWSVLVLVPVLVLWLRRSAGCVRAREVGEREDGGTKPRKVSTDLWGPAGGFLRYSPLTMA